METPTEDLPSADACFQRGRMLQDRQRFADAVQWYQRALQADAHHAPSYAMLALCWARDPARADDAVRAARQAVTQDAEDSSYRGILALVLAGSAREGQKGVLTQALEEARAAVKLDGESSFAHAVMARIHLALLDFPAAEQSARQALALDTEDTMAAEVLSIALLQQHKDEDNAGLVQYQLRRNPEDFSSHTSAGWLALRQGRQKEANAHFAEALRLNPMSEGARQGLVESYRARSVVYRTYIRFGHFMSRFSANRQIGILIGGYLVYRVCAEQIAAFSPAAAAALTIAWLLLALWSHLARGVGSFFMVFDRFARRALRPREFWEGVVVGGLAMLALLFVGRTIWTGRILDRESAILLFLSAIPAAAAFTNHHYWGKWVYAAVAAVAGLSALYMATAALLLNWRLPGLQFADEAAFYLAIGVTWVRLLRIGYC